VGTRKSLYTLDTSKQFVDEEGGRIFQDSLKDGGQGPEMVQLPAGAFLMGDIQGEGEGEEKPVQK
jgi:formylglycine-generating enzyme required for sulfatase activity